MLISIITRRYTMPVYMEFYKVFYTAANTKSISKASKHLFMQRLIISIMAKLV